MPYRIKPVRPLTGEIRRVAEEQLRTAIDVLTHQPDGVHEAIHEARKKFKRVRNLYRLVAYGKRDFRRQENTRLRDAAAALSHVRDATALIETLSYLQGHAETAGEQNALEHARQVLTERRDAVAAAETDLEEKVHRAIAECEAAIEAVDALSFDDGHRKAARLLAKGWKKSLRKACAALEACHEAADAEAFHELRKAGQAYWMNLSLLRDVWPSAMRAKRGEAKSLVDMLGHEHDIALLVELLNDDPGLLGGGEELSHLLGVIIRQQQVIRREALERAGHIFGDGDQEAGIVKLLWNRAERH